MSYTLISEIGRGGMGIVWRARDDETGRLVALKLLRDAYADDAEYRQRFEHEMSIAKRIDSPHVVKVLGFGVRDDIPYIAFELVEGPSLRQLLVSHGPYPWPETRALLLQLAEGLADAHATGVVHRDVKPSNVLIVADGTAKLADFGISHAVDLTRVTRVSGLMGTPTYLAPEGPVDARSDLYSLGIVTYEVLTGAAPFTGTSYHEVLAAHVRRAPDLTPVPAEARPLLAWMLAKEPEDRPQSARQLIRALLGEEPIPDIDSAQTIPMPPRRTAAGDATARDATAAATPGTGGSVPEVTPTSPGTDWSKLSFGAQRKTATPGSAPVAQVAAPGVVAAPAEAAEADPPAVAAVEPAPLAPRSFLASPAIVGMTAAGFVLVAALAAGVAFFGLGRGAQPPASPSPTALAAVPTATPATPTPSLAISPSAPPSRIPLQNAKWLTIGSLPETAFGDTAALLADGKVIVFSTTLGVSHTATGHSWIVNPDTGHVDPGPTMWSIQSSPSSVRLSDGSVMVVGGWDSNADAVTSAEILSPTGAAWTALRQMNVPRSQATITDLGGGRILVAGGWTRKNGSDSWTPTDTAEVYDRADGSWTLVDPMSTPRALAAAALLPNGHVLVTGGDSDWPSTAGQATLGTAEEFNPDTGGWTARPSMGSLRAAHVTVRLSDGRILVAGGWSDGRELGQATAQTYSPSDLSWHQVNAMPGAHAQGRALSLPDGRVLVMGGWDAAGVNATSTVDLFDPETSTWSRIASLKDPVYWPGAAVLANGNVLVVGGFIDNTPSHLIQVLTPAP